MLGTALYATPNGDCAAGRRFVNLKKIVLIANGGLTCLDLPTAATAFCARKVRNRNDNHDDLDDLDDSLSFGGSCGISPAVGSVAVGNTERFLGGSRRKSQTGGEGDTKSCRSAQQDDL